MNQDKADVQIGLVYLRCKLVAYLNLQKIADNSKTTFHHQKTTLMGCSELNSKNLKFFIRQQMLPKCYPKFVANPSACRRHHLETIS